MIRCARFVWLVVLLVGLASRSASAALPVSPPKLTRGPYLQMMTSESVFVRWRTEQPSASVVRYGRTAEALSSMAAAQGLTKEHIVRIDGLQPGTKYYYSIGNSEWVLAGGDAQHFFITSPPPGARVPTRVWVLGDSGTGNANARAVRDAYLKLTEARSTDVWLMLGDNAYRYGTDAEYQKSLFETYPESLRTLALWPTLGNHDARSASSSRQSGPYYDLFSLPTQGEAGGSPSGTEAYYSFKHANIHFICLDSSDSDRSTNSPMVHWLRRDLQLNNSEWTIAFWHHPPYSRGGHDSDDLKNIEMREMRENILPVLEGGGVDLVLNGHSHSYERSFFLHGHYGRSAPLMSAVLNRGDGRGTGSGAYVKSLTGPRGRQGTVYVVAGSSGKTSGGMLNHPVMCVSTNALGSLVIDVLGAQLDAAFLNDKGVVLDRFTILKR